MLVQENYLVFPEGDVQEIPNALAINDLIDMNGRRLTAPLPTTRMIAFRIVSIRVKEDRGSRAAYHYGELVPTAELSMYARS